MIPADPESIMAMTGWALFLTLFILPFVQEDVAVIAAATASIAGAESTALIFLAILIGVSCSDVWKYWLGWIARRYSWAQRFAEKPGVSVAGTLVKKELYQTLVTARFVPGTRIPTYIACGFYESPYLRFVLLVISTAFLYISLMFGLFHIAGEVIGEKAAFYLPFIAVFFLASYILVRWLSHRAKNQGPMAPFSMESEKPTPSSGDIVVDKTLPDQKEQ